VDKSVWQALLPVMPGLDPGIRRHAPWIAGSSPAMTPLTPVRVGAGPHDAAAELR